MIPQLRAIAKAERMFLTPFSFCHFSLAVRSWTKRSVENCCCEFPASVFCSSFSIALLQRHRYYYSIALSPPTKCLPQNLPLSICSPLGKEMEEKKGMTKRTRGREREREKSLPQECLIKASYRQRPRIPLGWTHSHSQQTNASAHTHTHTITVSAHVYHIAAYIKANYVATHLRIH